LLVEGSPEATETLAEAGRLASVTGLDIISGAYRALARISAAAGSAEGELAGMLDVLEEHARSRLAFALRGNLRMFAPAFSALGRHRMVAVLATGAVLSSPFPRRTEQAIERARQELGPAAYDAAVAHGRAMTDDELAAYIRSELNQLGITE
jgi:hypothetical protein